MNFESVLLIALFGTFVGAPVAAWAKNRFTTRATKIAGTTSSSTKPAKKSVIFANSRKGVITAYTLDDLKDCDANAMLLPKAGLMVFTNDEGLPRTGKYDGLELLAAATDCEIRWMSEYAFYTIGRSVMNPAEDIRDYGKLVLNVSQAMARAKSQQRAA